LPGSGSDESLLSILRSVSFYIYQHIFASMLRPVLLSMGPVFRLGLHFSCMHVEIGINAISSMIENMYRYSLSSNY